MTKKQLINELITVKEQNRLLTVIQTKLTGLEDALRKSEKKYRELVNLLPQPVFEIDVEGNLTFSNIDGFKTFGYEYEDLYRGVNAFQMVVPEERSRMKCNMQKVLQGKALGGIEYSALKKDGTVFPIVVFSSTIKDHKKPTGIRGIIIELSKLKHAEEELRRSEHKYRLLVENANEIIVIIQDGQVKFANPKST
jgi:PAS domain S-box-containing protein